MVSRNEMRRNQISESVDTTPKMLWLTWKGNRYLYLQNRDISGLAHEFVFTESQMKDALKRAEKIHSRPMGEYALEEIFS